jgi:succinate dehydrogenase hydrophobic anchor subunit
METNKRNLFIFIGLTGLYIFLMIFYLPGNQIELTFNANDEPFVFSKVLILVFTGLISYFIGFQINDEKNKGDYTRWYVFGLLLLVFEAWIIISNL